MAVSCQSVINVLEKLAPPYQAEKWDRIGLQIGNPGQPVRRLFLSLDLDQQVLEEALHAQADMIVVHHTPFFKPLDRVRTDLPGGRLLAEIVRRGLILYAAHTNLDAAENGINDALAARLGLRQIEILGGGWKQKLYKIAVFVPASYVFQVQEALTSAGAGWIGQYSDCTFRVQGTGTFRPLEGTSPFIGSRGELSEVAEARLETIAPAEIVPEVIAAMKKAHPYEEVAYDIYPLLNEGKAAGLGRVGYLAENTTLLDFVQTVKTRLGVRNLRYCGEDNQQIVKVAVCGGAGASLLSRVISAQAQVFVTADIKYHQAQEALAHGLALIDAGHYATEQLIIPVLRQRLAAEFGGKGPEIIVSAINTDPFKYC